ncbi:MAG: hypothetical protein WCI45_02200 [Desulfuromonadales bacterium]
MTADVSKLEPPASGQIIPKSVGYYFVESRDKIVETAGGGGDKVKYSPYKDIEGGFFKILSNTFKSAISITSEKDSVIGKSDLGYIMAVEVSTNSSSPSLFTWPPTVFGINLTANISDVTGKPVTRLLVFGEGRGEFDEFKGNHSLAANRASIDVLKKMQTALLNTPELRSNASVSLTKTGNDAPLLPLSKEVQLKDLKRLFDSGLITNEIYVERQKSILGG